MPTQTRPQRGRPRKKALSEQMMTRQTAWDFSSFIGYFPDPDRILEKLGLDEDIAYQDILTDDHLTAVWGKRQSNLTDLEWDIEPGDASEKVAKEMRAIFKDLDIHQFIKDVQSAKLHGRAPIEEVWDTSGSVWYPEQLLLRPTRWYGFDDENRVRFYSDSSSINGVLVPDYKLLFPRNNPTYDNPYGEKLLSKCYWPITWKRNSYRWWNVFMEKFSIPYMIAKVEPNTGPEEKSKILQALTDMVQDGIMTMPKSADVEIMQAGGKSSNGELFNSFKYAMDSSTSKVILGGTLTTEQGEVGSYSLGEIQKDGENQLRDDDKLLVESTANELINHIMYFNFSGPSPTFVMKPAAKASKDLADRDKILTETGVKFTKKYFINNHNLHEDEFEIAEVEPENDNKNDDKNDEPKFSQSFLEKAQLFKESNIVGDEIDEIQASELQKQADGMLKPIIDLINNSSSYEDAGKNLLAQYPKMNSTALEDMLLQALFVSETLGRSEQSE